jgi:hypothetical protein
LEQREKGKRWNGGNRAVRNLPRFRKFIQTAFVFSSVYLAGIFIMGKWNLHLGVSNDRRAETQVCELGDALKK